MKKDEFQELIWRKGSELFRSMAWRDDTRSYFVLISELMLQQTQVNRVIPKFNSFIARFPNEEKLAEASLGDVLIEWQGLGYNRRAKYLHEAAKMVVNQFDGSFPANQAELIKLPGVGLNTAGAIAAYSFNQPSIFIETNIRTVYIHHFFGDDFEVDDKQIRAKLEETLDQEHPREFYWALMDYGASLKASGIRNVSRSKHYKKQMPLEGSVRQVRGQIIRLLSSKDLNRNQLKTGSTSDHRFEVALTGLKSEGLITETNGRFHLTK